MTKAAYRRYIASPEWKARRRELIGDRPRRCDACGEWRAPAGLDAHHLPGGYKHLGHETARDVTILCGKCHLAATRGTLDPLEPPVPVEELAEALGGET